MLCRYRDLGLRDSSSEHLVGLFLPFNLDLRELVSNSLIVIAYLNEISSSRCISILQVKRGLGCKCRCQSVLLHYVVGPPAEPILLGLIFHL